MANLTWMIIKCLLFRALWDRSHRTQALWLWITEICYVSLSSATVCAHIQTVGVIAEGSSVLLSLDFVVIPWLKLNLRYLNICWTVFKMWRVADAEDTEESPKCPAFPNEIVWTLWTYPMSIFHTRKVYHARNLWNGEFHFLYDTRWPIFLGNAAWREANFLLWQRYSSLKANEHKRRWRSEDFKTFSRCPTQSPPHVMTHRQDITSPPSPPSSRGAGAWAGIQCHTHGHNGRTVLPSQHCSPLNSEAQWGPYPQGTGWSAGPQSGAFLTSSVLSWTHEESFFKPPRALFSHPFASWSDG